MIKEINSYEDFKKLTNKELEELVNTPMSLEKRKTILSYIHEVMKEIDDGNLNIIVEDNKTISKTLPK